MPSSFLGKRRAFLSIDTRSLTLFRICCSLYAIYDLYKRSLYLIEWHTDIGILDPLQTPHKCIIHRILFYRGSPMLQQCLFFVQLIVSLCLLVGYRTSISSLLHFIFTISVQERMYYILDGGDRLFRNLSFWLIFLPSWFNYCRHTSVDEINIEIAHINHRIDINDDGNHKERKRETINHSFRSWATAGILIQCLIIYPMILINRWNGKRHTWHWNTCSAVHLSMSSYDMSTDFALMLAGYPYLCFIICRMVIIMEYSVPGILLLVPFDNVKILCIFILCSMHISFNIFMRLENFAVVNCIAMVLFLPPVFWEFLSHFCYKYQFIHKLQSKYEIWIISKLSASKKYWSLNKKKSDDHILHTFLWNIPIIINKLIIKENFSSVLSFKPIPSKVNNILSLFFLLYLFMNNLGDVQLRLIPKFDDGNIGEILRIDQQWLMFGPDVNYKTYFQVLFGNISINSKAGNKTNSSFIVLNDMLFNNKDRIITALNNISDYRRPFNPTFLFPNMRWERLFIKAFEHENMRKSIVKYFCRQFNANAMRKHTLKLQLKYYDSNDTQYVSSARMRYGVWCRFSGEIVDLWLQNVTYIHGQRVPQYINEEFYCKNEIILCT